MSERPLGKRHPAHVAPQQTSLPLNDLQTSSAKLHEFVGAEREKQRILNDVDTAQRRSPYRRMSFEKLRRLINKNKHEY